MDLMYIRGTIVNSVCMCVCIFLHIFILLPGVERRSSAVRAQSFNHWTAGEFPTIFYYILKAAKRVDLKYSFRIKEMVTM